MVDIFERLEKNTGGPIGQYMQLVHGYFAFPKLEGELGPHMRFRGKMMLNWSLNNYLGLASNETIINANLKNSSYFPIRRFSLSVTISYDADLKSAVELLKNVPQQCSLHIPEPEPQVFIESFEDSGIKLTLAAWTKSENYMDFKNQLFITVKETLEANNIEIPYKKLVLVK